MSNSTNSNVSSHPSCCPEVGRLQHQVRLLNGQVRNLQTEKQSFANSSLDSKKENEKLRAENRDLKTKVTELERKKQYHLDKSRKGRKDNEELRLEDNELKITNTILEKENRRLQDLVRTLRGEKLELKNTLAMLEQECSRNIAELEKENKQQKTELGNYLDTMNMYKKFYEDCKDTLSMYRPLFKLALAIRQRFWQDAKERLGLGVASRELKQAGNKAAHRPNIEVDAALIRLPHRNYTCLDVDWDGSSEMPVFEMTPELFEKLYLIPPMESKSAFWIELTNILAFCTMVGSTQPTIERLGGPNSELLAIHDQMDVVYQLYSVDLPATGASLREWDGKWYTTILNSTADAVAISSRCKNEMSSLRKSFERFAGYFREPGSTLAIWNELDELNVLDERELDGDHGEYTDSQLEVDQKLWRGSPGCA